MNELEHLKIDPEFQRKIPPLSEAEYQQLRENILADGEVREPIVVWNDIIIDGHNRWRIIQENPKLHYKVKRMDFPDHWAAVAWMYKNQLGRRNITPEQREYLIGKQYEAEKNRLSFCGNQHTGGLHQNGGDHKGPTANRIAKEHGIGTTTVERARNFAKGVDIAEQIHPGIKGRILSGDTKATRAQIREIKKMEPKQREEMVEKIANDEPLARSEPKPNEDQRSFHGRSKENHQRLDIARNVSAEMRSVETTSEYGIDDLLDEIIVNADNYIKQLRRTLTIRSTLLTSETRPRVQQTIEEKIIQAIEKVGELIAE